MIPIVSRRGEHFGERKQYMYSKYDYEIASRCDALCSEVEDRAVHSNHAEPEALWAARRLGGASASREGRPRLIPYPFHVLPGYSAPACPSPAPRPRAPRGGLSGTVYYGLRYPRHRYAGPGGHADTRWADVPMAIPTPGFPITTLRTTLESRVSRRGRDLFSRRPRIRR